MGTPGRRRIVGLGLSSSLLLAPTVAAQSGAAIAGLVRDSSGAVLPGVT
jgi:hypothetical protein